MSRRKQGPSEPQFFAFDAPDRTRGMYDGRPTKRRALSPRPSTAGDLHSNSHEPMPGSPRFTPGRTPQATDMAYSKRAVYRSANTNANRRNGGGSMYYRPTEGFGQ